MNEQRCPHENLEDEGQNVSVCVDCGATVVLVDEWSEGINDY